MMADDRPYYGDSDHAPPWIDRGGRDTRPEAKAEGQPVAPRRFWIFPRGDGTLEAAPDTPAWGGGGILVEEVDP